jgi:hypothetical protein
MNTDGTVHLDDKRTRWDITSKTFYSKPKFASRHYSGRYWRYTNLSIGPTRRGYLRVRARGHGDSEEEGNEAMSTEVAGLILAVLLVVYSIRTALSGMRGRPKSPTV